MQMMTRYHPLNLGSRRLKTQIVLPFYFKSVYLKLPVSSVKAMSSSSHQSHHFYLRQRSDLICFVLQSDLSTQIGTTPLRGRGDSISYPWIRRGQTVPRDEKGDIKLRVRCLM